MKIAVSADWHLDYMNKTYLIDGIPNRELDLDKQITTMLDECCKRKVEWFVVAGDLFDKSVVSAYYFIKVVNAFRRFHLKNIKVAVISGNHETKESGTALTNILGKLHDKSIYVTDRIQLFEKAGIIFIPHIKKEIYKDFENYTDYVKHEISKYKISKPIIIGHFQPTTSVPGAEQEMFAGSTRYVDCSIFKNSLVICGHVHKPQDIGRVIIPGSPVRHSLAERKEIKRFVIYDTETQNLESIPLHCQQMALINIDLYSKNTFSLPVEKLKKYKDQLVYIRITTSKKNRYKISARDVMSKFEQVNAKVMDYEVRTMKENTEELEKSDGKTLSMMPNKIFIRNTNKMVENVESRKRIISLGKTILEVIND